MTYLKYQTFIFPFIIIIIIIIIIITIIISVCLSLTMHLYGLKEFHSFVTPVASTEHVLTNTVSKSEQEPVLDEVMN